MSRRDPSRPRGQSPDAWERLTADLDESQLQMVMERARRDPAVAALLRRELNLGRIRGASRGPRPLAPDDSRPEPAGARLDAYPWARSWGAFMGAVRDKSDAAGARAVIRRLMESDEVRPRNAAGGLSERVPAEGGFLVPERLRQTVLTYMQTGIVQPRAMPVQLDSERVPVPVLDNASEASGAQALGGLTFSFTQEGQAITPTAPAFGQVVLEAWPDKALMKNVPNELIADSLAFTEDFLPRIIAQGLSWHIDDIAIYQGTGVGQPQALVNAPAAAAVTRSDPSGFHVSHLDVVTMLKSLHPASKCCATWLASEDMFDQLLELYEIVGSAPTGQDIPPPGTLKYNSDSGRWELLGLEIIANEHQPALNTAGDLMLADLNLLLLGERAAMTVEVAPHAGFGSDTSHIRVRYRWDARFWPQSSYTTPSGKTISPLVVLH